MAEELFTRLFHLNPVATVLLRAGDFAVLDANDAMCSILGYARKELLGRPVTELDIWPDLEERRRLGERLAQEHTIRDYEFTLKNRNGERRQAVGFIETAMRDNEAVFLAGLADVTERRRSEEEIR